MMSRILVRLGMLKTFVCLAAILCSYFADAQRTLPDRAVQLVAGYSRHGSGDMNGIVFGTEYVKYLSQRFSLNYNLRASINDGKETIIVKNAVAGTETDASVRLTTAGVQLGINGGWSLVRGLRHEVMVSLGAFGRYQSASNGSDGYSIYYPLASGQPTVLIGYDNRTPQETFSFGGIFQIRYSYTFKNKIYIGVLPGFQTDTNGDAMPQILLAAGIRI